MSSKNFAPLKKFEPLMPQSAISRTPSGLGRMFWRLELTSPAPAGRLVVARRFNGGKADINEAQSREAGRLSL